MKGSKGKKKCCPTPWTKQFYCLGYCNQDQVPYNDEELDELYHAGLGIKKITIADMNGLTNSRFRKIIVDNYPLLKEAGGFEFLRCVHNSKRLELFSELAQANPQVLQERSHKGRIYVRHVQKDLLQSTSPTLKKPCVGCINYKLYMWMVQVKMEPFAPPPQNEIFVVLLNLMRCLLNTEISCL